MNNGWISNGDFQGSFLSLLWLQWTILKYEFSSPLAILQAQRGLELISLAIIITLTSSIFLCMLRDTMIIFLYYIQ